MLKKDSPIFLQNMNVSARQLFLLFKKSRLSGTTLVDDAIITLSTESVNHLIEWKLIFV